MKIKQYNIKWIGPIIDSLYTALPLLSIINFLSILTVLYATTRDYLLTWAPWLTFWMFVLILALFTLITMGLFYKFVLPSVWTFRQKQMFGFESGLVDRLDKIEKMLCEIKEKSEAEK